MSARKPLIRRGWPTVIVIVVLIVAGAWFAWLKTAHGFSASAQPTAIETFLATLSRRLALPGGVNRMTNPYAAPTPMQFTMAAEHFAAHCALCHNNNGDGLTDIGRNLYPKPPNLHAPETQNMSDGALFYSIRNGIRLSGMPAWPDDSDKEIWLLVAFIRRLPRQTPAELQTMKKYNPTTLFPEPIM